MGDYYADLTAFFDNITKTNDGQISAEIKGNASQKDHVEWIPLQSMQMKIP